MGKLASIEVFRTTYQRETIQSISIGIPQTANVFNACDFSHSLISQLEFPPCKHVPPDMCDPSLPPQEFTDDRCAVTGNASDRPPSMPAQQDVIADVVS